MILGECTLFPESSIPLFIFEPRYRTMLAEALDGHRMFCLAMQKPGSTRETPSPVAGLGLVRACHWNENGTANLVLQGLARVRLGRVVQLKPYRLHEIEIMTAETRDPAAAAALSDRLLDLVDARLHQGSIQVPVSVLHVLSSLCPDRDHLNVSDCLTALRSLSNPGALADLVAMLLLPEAWARQSVMETSIVEDRLAQLIQLMAGEVARLQKKAAPGD